MKPTTLQAAPRTFAQFRSALRRYYGIPAAMSLAQELWAARNTPEGRRHPALVAVMSGNIPGPIFTP